VKISRSKLIEMITALTIFIFLIVYAFVFYNGESNEFDISYAYNEMVEPSNNEEVNNIELKPSEELTNDVDLTSSEEITNDVELVYDNMTLEQLSDKLNRSLNSTVSGYGNFIASYALEKGIDPYLATAILLHETGCTWECSSLVKKCNNVGGMKGSGCGSYGYFNTLEEGIQKFIDNLYNNYYAYGLTNATLMGNKYAEDPEWSKKVNVHIEKIKNR